MCYETYKLDPGYYYSALGLAWDAFLKYTKIELELIADPEIALMFDALNNRTSQICKGKQLIFR